jgi:hypothetical protein
LKSDTYSRTVAISLKNGEGHFSDNYFDLLPEKPYEVDLTSSENLSPKEVLQRLTTTSLAEMF